MQKTDVILYFYPQKATFVQKDLDILNQEFTVYECGFQASQKWKTPILFLKQIAFLLTHFASWKKATAIVQFAGYHSFIPSLWAKLFSRPCIIVAGGMDCVSFPSLGYGNFQNRLLALFSAWSYRLVKVVSAVHKSLFIRKDNYYLESESEQGILHFVPTARFIQNEIPNGFDTTLFAIKSQWAERKTNSFISISASLDDPIRMKLKGIDMVLELAKACPELSFTLVGSSGGVNLNIPGNVNLVPFVANDQLPDLYNQHQFYMQLSISEGFPNSVCEAMACGCIPIVSAVASMPEIVGETGLIISKRDINELKSNVLSYIKTSGLDLISSKCADSILKRYPLERRNEELIKLIKSLN